MEGANPSARPSCNNGIFSIEGNPELSVIGGAETVEKPIANAADVPISTILPLIYTSDEVVLIKRRGRWVPPKTSKLRNTLLSTMGLLELANAGDFAANVWNEIPVPIYAVVFMALGGTLAFVVSVLALKDAMLSWDNISYLRRERASLKNNRAARVAAGQPTLDVDVLLDLNFRELGSEITNRFGLDICSGFGAFVISIGTYMAIGGADRRVWFASNLLSGYFGNAPIALYGLASSMWSGYIFRRASQHRAFAARAAQLQDHPAKELIGRRSRNVQIYTSISATSSLVGGAASMVTATSWWGYVVLIPVILSSMFYNSWLRRKVAYDRPPVGNPFAITDETIIRELELAEAIFKEIRGQASPIEKLVPDATSLEMVLCFLTANDLQEQFCIRLLLNESLALTLADPGALELVINAKRIMNIPKEQHPMVIEIANETLKKQGAVHFEYRQRYLAEILGSILRMSAGH